MKQTLLLMVLALGMCSGMGFAQKKEYHVEDDGFEWYELRKYENGQSYHEAQDKFGNTIIPPQKDMIIIYRKGFFDIFTSKDKHGIVDKEGHLIVPMEYEDCSPYFESAGVSRPYIKVSKVIDNELYEGIYDFYGKCILPISRRYKQVYLQGKDKSIYWLCQDQLNTPTKFSLCDASGKEFYTTPKAYGWCYLIKHPTRSKMYELILREPGKTYSYFVDKNNNVLLEGWLESRESFHNEHNVDITRGPTEILPEGGKNRKLTQAELNKVFFSANWLDGNSEYFAHASEYPMYKIGEKPSSNSTASSNTGSNSSNNPGGGTTTVVVDHHRDQVPVQEWQQCPACYGSGQCPNVQCGGSGWYYIGDKARTCSRCHGSGKCTICAGKGGHYVTVYR